MAKALTAVMVLLLAPPCMQADPQPEPLVDEEQMEFNAEVASVLESAPASRPSRGASSLAAPPLSGGCANFSFTQEHVQYTVEQINTVDMNWVPFPHFHLTDVFHPDLYACLVQELPRTIHPYKPLASPKDKVPEGQRRRYSISLLDEDHTGGTMVGPARRFITRAQKKKGGGTFEKIPSGSHDMNVHFWKAWSEVFNSDLLKRAYLDKFAPTLRSRLGNTNLTVDALGDQTRWEVALTRDIDGYSIGPHVDGPRKWVTSIYYLAKQGDGNENAGTYVLEATADGEAADSAVGWKGYKAHERVRFVPNSVFVFSPCKDSWHAVPQLPSVGSTSRDTLQAFIKSSAGFDMKRDIKMGMCPTGP